MYMNKINLYMQIGKFISDSSSMQIATRGASANYCYYHLIIKRKHTPNKQYTKVDTNYTRK